MNFNVDHLRGSRAAVLERQTTLRITAAESELLSRTAEQLRCSRSALGRRAMVAGLQVISAELTAQEQQQTGGDL